MYAEAANVHRIACTFAVLREQPDDRDGLQCSEELCLFGRRDVEIREDKKRITCSGEGSKILPTEGQACTPLTTTALLDEL